MKKILKKILKNFQEEEKLDFNFKVDYPANKDFGHYSTNYALVLAKIKRDNPEKLAQELVTKLKKQKEFSAIFKAQVAKPGFINFWLKEKAFLKTLAEILDSGNNYGCSRILAKRKIMVEYAQPNPFKAFHVGHLRNIIIGESLARVLENAGAKVIRTNYQGDVGLHVAKCFWGIKNKKNKLEKNLKNINEKVSYLADCYILGAKAYRENVKAQKEIQEINQKIYAMSEDFKTEWEEKKRWSLDKFEEIFQKLDVHFDRYYFESEMFQDGIKKCREAEKKGILIKDDDCLIFDGEKFNLNKRVFINKKGLPTYEGKELALAFKEFTDFGELDKAIHIVANEQINFFRITFLVEKLLAEQLFDDKQFHLSYGLVNLKEGKMSSREGNVILGEEIIQRAENKIRKLLGGRSKRKAGEIANADKVAVGAIKYSFLAINPAKNINFDLEESIRLEGRSGPYVIYSYVRAVNLLKKLSGAGYISRARDFKEGFLCQEGKELIYCLSKFPNLTKEVAKNYQLSMLADYSYRLANIFSVFYDKCPVLKQEEKELQKIRIGLIGAFKKTMGKCLDLLGIERVEKM
jgi:arginyl-tRNA synthetase